MTNLAWVFGGVALVVGLVEWWATYEKRVQIRYVTKPLALIMLIGVAVTLTPLDDTIRTWMVAGLVLSLAGDIFLLGPEKYFVGGLASFLLGHIAYVAALQQAPRSISWTVVGLVVVAASIAIVGAKIINGVKAGGNDEMVIPVIAYLVVISAMVVSAFGTAAPWAIIGASLFYASDATLAWNRFIEVRRLGGVAVMVTYHLGQAGLVAWLVTG